jgi:Cdc6-like AAA superfamily ATPase
LFFPERQLAGTVNLEGSIVNDMQIAPLHGEHASSLNSDQQHAVAQLIAFIESPYPESWYFCFTGYAGTGKTFCMREVVSRCRASAASFAYTAPTNKAAKVLKEVVGEAGTIYSLLGLRVDKSGELKTVVGGKPVDLSDLDVIVVDEASMVNQNLFNHLESAAERFHLKVVFMGDLAQLPPVKEAQSPSLSGFVGANLTRVMRHDNQILTFATSVREQINHLTPSIKIASDNDGQQGVWKLDQRNFKMEIFNAAQRGDFADGRFAKIIAWRNVRVAEYNNIARAALYGADAVPGFFLSGDRIVAAGPCERGDEYLMSTDDEGIVESVAECVHPLEPKYHALELKVRREDNKVVRLLVIHPQSKQTFDNDAEQLAHLARANSKLWKRFWEHKELFHDVRYAYAITAHRSQGSTYNTAFVDFQDILYNRNRKEAFQCLYVASTRPTTKLILA